MAGDGYKGAEDAVKTLPGGGGRPKEQRLKSFARSHHDRRLPRAQRGCQAHTVPEGRNVAGGRGGAGHPAALSGSQDGAAPERWRCRPQGADGALERREDQRAWGRPGPSVTLTRAFGGHSRRKTQPCLVAWGQGLPDTACWGQPSGARSLLAPAGKETLGHWLPGPRTGAGRKARLPGRRLILTSETLTFDRNWFHRETAAAAPGPDWTSLQRDFGCTCPACRWWAAVLAS